MNKGETQYDPMYVSVTNQKHSKGQEKGNPLFVKVTNSDTTACTDCILGIIAVMLLVIVVYLREIFLVVTG